MGVTLALLLTLSAHIGDSSRIRAAKGIFEAKSEERAAGPGWASVARDIVAVIANRAATLPDGPEKEFLTQLRPCAPCSNFERFGEQHDGGYVMCNDHLDESLRGVFSYGINGFDDWGMSLASRFGAVLHEYDCFNPSVPDPCHNCEAHFHNVCLGSANNESLPPNFQTLSTHLHQSSLPNVGRDLVLKLDIEGAEWQILVEEPVENLQRFRQIVVEFHGILPAAPFHFFLQAVAKLEEAGFAVAHLHGNNVYGPQRLGEFSVPQFFEVTYVPAPSGGCVQNLPVHLPEDASNVPELPEVHVVIPEMSGGGLARGVTSDV